MDECLHSNFKSQVMVFRLADHPENPANGYVAEVHIQCAACGTDFEFLGLAGGSHPTQPTMSFDKLEARLPIKPKA